MKNPLEVAGISGSIARVMPIEGGPATEAMLERTAIVRATWGHYASTLLEYWSDRGIDYAPEEILELLGITPDMLRDDSIQFTRPYSFENYENLRRAHFKSQAENYFAPESKRLSKIIDTIRSGYIVDKAKADLEAADLREALRNQDDDSEIARMILKAEALESGVCIPLQEYVAVMLSVQTIQAGEFQSELARAWLRGVREVIMDATGEFVRCGVYDGDLQTAEGVFVGDAAFSIQKSTITAAYYPILSMTDELWETIRPAFVAPKLENHPVITGKHD